MASIHPWWGHVYQRSSSACMSNRKSCSFLRWSTAKFHEVVLIHLFWMHSSCNPTSLGLTDTWIWKPKERCLSFVHRPINTSLFLQLYFAWISLCIHESSSLINATEAPCCYSPWGGCTYETLDVCQEPCWCGCAVAESHLATEGAEMRDISKVGV